MAASLSAFNLSSASLALWISLSDCIFAKAAIKTDIFI